MCVLIKNKLSKEKETNKLKILSSPGSKRKFQKMI
jgi:hypothetical protein